MDWRARVLVENADSGVGFAMQELLKNAAFDVQYCGGPDRLRGHRCPLVTEGRCSLVEGADVVVHSLNLDRPDHAAVLQGIRDLHPDTPVVVEVPTPVMEKHADLLDGFTIVPMPATRAALTNAVRHALSGA
jgi:hypothetical protein